MFGLSTSQSTAVIVMLASVVMYFAANNGLKQNAFLFVFTVALTILVVGRWCSKLDLLFMNERTFEYEPHYENWSKRQ